MMKVLVYINGMSGVSLHRLILPYSAIHCQYPDEMEVEFVAASLPREDMLSKVRGADVFVFNRSMDEALLADIRQTGIKVICDNDDLWMLPQSHPLAMRYRANRTTERIVRCMNAADYVTVSTPRLQKKVKAIGIGNVTVFPNALKQMGQFGRCEGMPSERVRFGIIGGSSHTIDMELLRGINSYIPDYIRDRMQWVLCGFDSGGCDVWRDGNLIGSEPAEWDNVCWTQWERMLTDDYRLIHSDHARFLRTFMRVDYESDDYYQRVWTKGVDEYAHLYDNIDVLVVPLYQNDFNSYKSELKMIEASVKGKALIISNVTPYSSEIVPIYEKGGTVNCKGNCLAIESGKTARAFAKAVITMVECPSIRELSAANLSHLTEEGGKFNLDKVAEDRWNWLRSL